MAEIRTPPSEQDVSALSWKAWFNSLYRRMLAITSELAVLTASIVSGLALKVAKAGDTMTGSLIFSGTGLRIQGDFSNATWTSRTGLQTSTTNANTDIPIIPNGTATIGAVSIANTSDITNAGFMQVISRATYGEVRQVAIGTGTSLPMYFTVGGSTRFRIGLTGEIAINTADYTKSIFGSAGTYQLNVNGPLFTNAINTLDGSATSTFHRDMTGNGAVSSVQGALQVGLHSTSNSDSITAGGPSILFFGFDDANPPAKAYISRFSGNVETGTAAGFKGGLAVNVRANLADSSATTLAQTWYASTNSRIEGYTQLGGSGAPAIKMKKLTGTSPAAEGGAQGMAHGVTASKIIAVSVLINRGDGNYFAPGYTYYAGYEYDVHIDGTNVVVNLHATNSENILSDAMTATIWYEE